MNALFGLYPRHDRRVPHISLVFREMWDTAGLPLKPVADPTVPSGCPTSTETLCFVSAYDLSPSTHEPKEIWLPPCLSCPVANLSAASKAPAGCI
jgi:hypothetical protein